MRFNNMRIAAAQIRSVAGDIPVNVEHHLRLIGLAAACNSQLVVFPELSITGYEPTLADGLAVDIDDNRFDTIQSACDVNNISVGIGAPIRQSKGVCIGLILFRPNSEREVFLKHYLHTSEVPFFVPGPKADNLFGEQNEIALAICYELSVPEHATDASRNGAEVYIASVADSAHDINRVLARLSTIASEYSMTVFFSNHVGSFNSLEAAGKTSAWNKNGDLLCQLDDQQEGLVVVDTQSGDATTRMLESI